MNAFDYVRPRPPAEAVAAASQPGAAYLAAGTNLARPDEGRHHAGRTASSTSPACPASTGSSACPTAASRIGALVRNADARPRSAISPQRYPAVAEALLSGASAQLRNAATVGGNLLQRTRCAYFYDTASACNKREPGAGCDARGGENRLHAVLGWSEHCIATHPSDFCVPLVALDAVVEIEGPAGPPRGRRSRRSTACPARRPSARPCWQPGELIVAVRLPPEAAAFAAHARYLKVRERTSYAFAVVSAAAALRLEGGRDRRGADRARRRRAQALAREGGRSRARRCSARSRGLPARRPTRRSPTPRRPATTPSRSSSPAASWCAR